MTILVVIIVVCLELLRTFFHCQDMYKLAREKGERPLKWILGTIAIWWTIEISVVLVWMYVLNYRYAIIGVFVGIALARMVYYFFRRILEEKNSLDMDEMIDQIGKKGKE
ncbi:MAG: hypothetical protein SF052_27660 [Bacteroidia bacterium]|nr:hypothetical protein [Bacteroidia bacterium]